MLISTPVLTTFDIHQKVRLTTDDSIYVINAVLQQEAKEGVRLIACCVKFAQRSKSQFFGLKSRAYCKLSPTCTFGAYLYTDVHIPYLQIIILKPFLQIRRFSSSTTMAGTDCLFSQKIFLLDGKKTIRYNFFVKNKSFKNIVFTKSKNTIRSCPNYLSTKNECQLICYTK